MNKEENLPLKICSKCKEEKSKILFSKSKATKDGVQGICKQCSSIIFKKYRESNTRKLKLLDKQWRLNNIEKCKEKKKAWNQNNPEKKRQHGLNWVKRNPEKIKYINTNKVLNLIPSYVKDRLRQMGFSKEILNNNPELIETQKLIIQFKRHIKNGSNPQ